MIKKITKINLFLLLILIFASSIENLNALSGNNTITYTIYENYDFSIDGFLEAGEEIESISLGLAFSAALTTSGRLFTWGLNSSGQLGDGTNIDKFKPTNITPQFNLGADEKITSISMGDSHSAALTSTGRLFTWGLNLSGQLGNDTILQSNIPFEITSQFVLNANDKIVQVDLGSLHSIAITSTGRIFSWGSNTSGQLGDNSQTGKNKPNEITSRFTSFNLAVDDKISFLSTGGSFSSVITSNGRVFTWGLNSEGQLGNGNTNLSTIPVEITSRFNLSGSEKVTLVTLGATHISALTSAGKVFTWGSNYDGELGDGTFNRRTAPTNITSRFGLAIGETITGFSMGSFHSSAITSNGRVFTWGYAGNGQLGEGTLTNRNTPMDITFRLNLSIDEKVTGISLGSRHSSVKTSTGRLFTWGFNLNGQLGNGTTRNRFIPENLTSEFGLIEQEKVDQMSLGEAHSAGLTSTGRLFTWGFNGDGRLGQGLVFPNIRNSVVPVDITEKFNLALNENIIQVSLGTFHSAALTSTGRVFTWGDNGSGQLGNQASTSTESTLPIDITARFNLAQGDRITFISLGEWNSSAISLNGQVFTWGNNNSGQLGNQSTNLSDVPFNITSRFSFSEGEKLISISIGNNHMIALTSTGRVFTWGLNSNGQLGNQSTNLSNVPFNITSSFVLANGETITKISAGENHSAAISSTGKVFTWGLNSFGQLGDNTVTQKTIPTNITSQFNLASDEQVTSVVLGHNHSSAITSSGRVFTWGQNSGGQLGDNTVTQKTIPTNITSRFNLIDNETITVMNLGGEFSSAISSTGRVFTWGWFGDGQLGFSFNMEEIFKPRRISSITTSTAETGSIVEQPVDPVMAGFVFNGWYTDETFSEKHDFTTALNSDITLFGEFLTQEEAVKKAIDAFPVLADITLANEAEIIAAREAYNALNDDQKGLVSNYQELVEAEEKIKDLNTPRIIIYYVLFNSVLSEVVKQGESLQLGLVSPVRRGFTFDGWVIEGQETIIDVNTFIVDEPVKLIAIFSRNSNDNESELVVDINGLESINLNTLFPERETSLEFLVNEKTRPNVDQDDLSSIESYINNDSIFTFDQMFILDISIEVTTLDENREVAITNITEPENPIKVTIKIPEIYLNYASYQIVRVHNGVSEYLATTLDVSTQTLSFESDKFSTYGILFSNALVDNLIALIDTIVQPTTLLDEASIQSIRDQYDALTPEQQAMITNYQKLLDAENVIEGLYAEINAVIAAINAITPTADLTILDEDDVQAARALYELLTEEQQALVSNYQILLDDEAKLTRLFNEIDETIALINAITPTADLELSDKDAIEAARASYDALSTTQQALVSNYQILLDDEAKLFILEKVDLVNKEIHALPEAKNVVTLDELKITKARDSYELLNNEEKQLIHEETLNHLIEAENALKQLNKDSNHWFWILPFHILSGIIVTVLYVAKTKKGWTLI